MSGATTAADVIRTLGLQPHPEGGYFGEIYREIPADGGRGACTSIYFLLAAGQVSHWHRVDAVEVWHYHAGAPLTLSVYDDDKGIIATTLGTNLPAGERPQGIVPANAWQSAKSLGDWTLVGCTVSPAFQFEGFELAAPGWHPGQ